MDEENTGTKPSLPSDDDGRNGSGGEEKSRQDRWWAMLKSAAPFILGLLLLSVVIWATWTSLEESHSPLIRLLIIGLATTITFAAIMLVYQVFFPNATNASEETSARNLMAFWFIAWASFTAFWLLNHSDGDNGIEYFLVVIVPAFFPLSAIAYVMFQRQRKVENLREQFSLLGLDADKSTEHPERSDPSITARYRKTHSTASFSIQTILPVLLSIIGVYLLFNVSGISEAQRVVTESGEEGNAFINRMVPWLDKANAVLESAESVIDNPSTTEDSKISDIVNDLKNLQKEYSESIGRLEKAGQQEKFALGLASPVTRALGFGFLGAYIFSVQLIYRRFTTLDLKPSIYMQCTGTLLAGYAFNYVAFGAITSLTMLDKAEDGLGVGLATIIAFSLGYFPGFAIRWFNRVAYKTLQDSTLKSDALSLSLIEGISDFHQVRLQDEGIDNIQNLASSHIEALIVNTPFTTLQLIDWIDQAILRLYVTRDDADAFRRGGVRGIADFRDLWRPFTSESNGVASNNHAAGAEAMTKVLGLSKKSLADRFQSTPEQLEILYLTSNAAPNLSFMGYPRRYSEVVTKRSESAQSDELAGSDDKTLFQGLLNYIKELESYEEMDEQLITIFAASSDVEGRLKPEGKERYALGLARWHRKLSEFAEGEDNKELQAEESEFAYAHYSIAMKTPGALSKEEETWYAENTPETAPDPAQSDDPPDPDGLARGDA